MNSRARPQAESTISDWRWTAIVARDAAADDRFVYSVSSTGVYCRPSCGSRRPRPEHVSFHATPADAERAGFRPCFRCRPDQPPLAERQLALIADLCRHIDAAEEMPSLDALAARAGLSRHHLHRLFKATTGLTPRAYAEACRAERVRVRLAGGAPVTATLYDAGYASGSRFYAAAPGLLGMRPGAARRGGTGETLRFALGQCRLGAILVASSQRGVCAISLGDDPEALLRELERRFPRAKLVGGDRDYEGYVARVVGFVDAPASALDLPLDIRGTVFQQRVWQALRAIPAGTTATYAQIAERIGAPRAARAVAGACAANMLAVAIPCHRVVRSDGDPAGYRWGVERKRALLAQEASP